MEARHAGIRHLLADDIRNPGIEIFLDLLLRQIETLPVIFCLQMVLLALFVKLVKTLLRAETAVCKSLFDQLLGIFHVDPRGHSLALDIRSEIAADIRPLVVRKPSLGQRPVDQVDCAFDLALLVGVL